MSLKIVVTGRNTRIANDIAEHLTSDRSYAVLRCQARKNSLLDMTLAELPQVVIICLREENGDTVRVYDVLSECSKIGTTSIIVVASDEDKATFMAYTELGKMLFLSRPVSLTTLYYKLGEIEKNWEKVRKEQMARITEYVNPNPPKELKRRHILVVDDDPNQLIQIKEHLREFYETTLVGSGKSVLKYLQKFKVDLILLDYVMPEMNGPAVLKQLREYEEYKDIPVIFLTGVSEKQTVIKTITELKPQGYVIKPTKKSEIVARIIEVLG